MIIDKLSRPKTNITYKLRCRITFIRRGRIVQGEGANQPAGEPAKGRKSHNSWYRHRCRLYIVGRMRTVV